MVEAPVTTTTTTATTVDAAPSIPEEEITDLQRLQAYCPEATEAERNRFLAAKGGNLALAKDQLQLYLSWRKQYGLDEDYHCSQRGRQEVWENCASDDQALDELDWKFASHKAMEYESSSSSSPSQQQQQQQLPQLARIIVQRDDDDHNNNNNSNSNNNNNNNYNNNNNNNNNRRHSCDKNGHRILQLLPAQMDLSMASESTFALCIALYLERKLCRKSYEKMTVVIDVRGGTGWANPPPQNLVPFIKQVSACLEQNFPERLAKSVIFPMPLPALLLWKMVKVFLDPNTVTKIDLVKGNASSKAKPPYRAMEEHMDKGVLEQMERLRCASFR